MQWPWKRASSKDQLIVSWSAQQLAFVQAARADGGWVVKRMGVERQGEEKLKDFAARLIESGLGHCNAMFMLGTEQSMLLQIPAPAVPPEELRSAVRYQIRDMVDSHIDDLTLDVLMVGDGQDKSAGQVFVVAANNAVVRDAMQLAGAAEWDCHIIDVQEMAQRNLQSAWARKGGLADRATAALMVVNDKQALFTISAHEELYYSRRLDLPADFMTMQWDSDLQQASSALDAYTPVGEYVPDYGSPSSGFGVEDSTLGGNDRAQRFLVEVQRSMDLWDRTWTSLPMAGVAVYAGTRSQELAEWLARGLGHTVAVLDPAQLYEGVPELGEQERLLCLPLLGLLSRVDGNG